MACHDDRLACSVLGCSFSGRPAIHATRPCSETWGAAIGQKQVCSGPDLTDDASGRQTRFQASLLGTDNAAAGIWLVDCSVRAVRMLAAQLAAEVHARCTRPHNTLTILLASEPPSTGTGSHSCPLHLAHARATVAVPACSTAEPDPPVQVCASYKYRMDLSSAAKVPGLLGRGRLLTRSEACSRVWLRLRLCWHFKLGTSTASWAGLWGLVLVTARHCLWDRLLPCACPDHPPLAGQSQHLWGSRACSGQTYHPAVRVRWASSIQQLAYPRCGDKRARARTPRSMQRSYLLNQ